MADNSLPLAPADPDGHGVIEGRTPKWRYTDHYRAPEVFDGENRHVATVLCGYGDPDKSGVQQALSHNQCLAIAELFAAAPETAAERDRLKEEIKILEAERAGFRVGNAELEKDFRRLREINAVLVGVLEKIACQKKTDETFERNKPEWVWAERFNDAVDLARTAPKAGEG